MDSPLMLSAQLVCLLLGIASSLLQVPTWIVFVLFVGLFAIYTVGMKRAWQVIRQSETATDVPDSEIPNAGSEALSVRP
jgi:heme A synthase